MIVKLPYGKEIVEFTYKEDRFKLIENNYIVNRINDEGIVKKFYSPHNNVPLDRFLDKDDKILVIVSDATRFTASDKIINLLLWELAAIGIKRDNIEFIIALGMHRVPTRCEISMIIGDDVSKSFKIHIHNAFDIGAMKYLGITRYGTPVYVNSKLFKFNKIIIISAIGYHYFAGYSGGRKSLIPGLASIETIKANHRLVISERGFGKNPNASMAKLYNNPVHLDLMEAANMIKIPIICINTILHRRELIDVVCGNLEESFYKACLDFSLISNVEVWDKRDIVIASCGGYPRDISVIQALKSLENATYFCKEGGIIILLAQCKGGMGNREFSNWLNYKDVDIFKEKLIRHYAINGQPAFTWRLHSINYQIIMVSQLPDRFQSKLNVRLFNLLDEAYKFSLTKLYSDWKGYIILHCWETIPSDLINFSELESLRLNKGRGFKI